MSACTILRAAVASGNAPRRPGRREPARPTRPPSSATVDLPTELEATRQELREALEQQTATAEILRAISESPTDVQPVLEAIARSAAQFCGAEDAFLLLRDGDRVQGRAHVGPIPVRIPGSIPLDRSSVSGRVILDGRTIEVGDAKNAADFPLGRVLARNSDHNRAFGTPLMHQDAAIGVLVLRRVEDRPFTERQRALAETFAAQAVIAIENVRLFNETKEALERQTAISEVLDAINSSAFDLERVLATMLEKAMQLCAADNGGIVQVEGDAARIVAEAGPPEHVALAREAFRDRQIRRDRGSLTGRVLLAGKTVQIPDMLNDPEYEGITTERITKVIGGDRTGLGVPLIRFGTVVGAILLRRQRVAPFTAAETSLVEAFAAQAVIAMENARLFNATKEALEQQTATSEVLKVISRSTSDLQPVFDFVVENANRLCAADHAFVYLPEGDAFRMVASFGGSPELVEINRQERRFLGRGSLVGRVALEEQVVQITDVLEDREYTLAQTQRVGGYRTMLGLPMNRGDGALVGIIGMARNEVRPFTSKEIELVETFADQAAIAIENVRLFNETKEALERQRATADILYTISTSPTTDQPVLDAVARNALRFCGAEDVLVLLVDGDVLERRAHAGTMRTVDRQGGPINRVPLVRETVSGRATLESRTIHVPDIQSSDEFPIGRELGQRLGEHANLAAPLLQQGKAMGAILLRRTDLHPFGDDEVALAEGFAAQAVIAIENVRLFNETKEALERQTAISEILRVISASPTDVRPVLEAIVENALRFCAAEDAAVMLPNGDQLGLAAHRGSVPVANDLRYPNDGTSVSSRAFLEATTIAVQDLQTAIDFPLGAENARSGGYHATVGAPLLHAGAAVGVIVLRRFDARPFSEREIGALETFAAQAVIAIENVRLFNEIREKSGQLEGANRELAAASRHKSEFLANMSHELRTPLNAIIGFSDVLEQRLFGELNERQADYTHDIASSGRHLLDLVNEILDLSKVEAGRMELEPSEFALAETIRGAVGFVRERAAAHRIELATGLPADLGTIVADERKVRQVLLNLLSNAVKFTPDGGTIGVRARRGNGEVEVSVRDTGIGIAPEDQAKVFDEFQQVGRSSDRSREGTGLGLTLAKRFIELHGGRIWIESEVGKGTTFTFAIPVAKSAAAPA